MKKTDTSLTKRFFAMVLTLLMVLCMLPVQTITAYADDGAYTINFTVRDKDKDGNPPIQGAQIKLEGQTKTTDADGKATFTVNEPAGPYVYAEVSAAHFVTGNPVIPLYQTVDFDLTLSENNPVKVNGIEKPYSPDGYEAVEIVDDDDCTLTYSLDGVTYGDMPTIKDVGEYTVYVKATAGDGFEFVPFTVSSKIVPATIGDITVTANEGLVYNKDGVEVISASGITGLQTGDAVEYIVGESSVKKYDFSGSVEPLTLYTAGEAAITVNVTRGTNYFFTTTLTVNIAAGESGLKFKEFDEATVICRYDDEAALNRVKSFAAESASTGEITYSVTTPDGNTTDIATIDAVGNLNIAKAGIVKVTASQAETAEYAASKISVTAYLVVNEDAKTVAFESTDPVNYVLQDVEEVIKREAKKCFTGDNGAITYTLSGTDDKGNPVDVGSILAVDDNGVVTIKDTQAISDILEEKNIIVTVKAEKAAVESGDANIPAFYPAGSDEYVINMSMSEAQKELLITCEAGPVNGWYAGTVTIKAKDGSKISLNPWKIGSFGDSITLKESGTYTDLKVYCKDKEYKLVYKSIELPEIKIDVTDPEIGNISYDVDPVSDVLHYITLGLKHNSVTVSAQVSDKHSGVDHVTFALPGYSEEESFEAELNEGIASYTFANDPSKNFIGKVTVTVTDVAGNDASKTGKYDIIMDNTEPVITAKFLTGTDAESGEKVYDAIPSGEDYCFGWMNTEVFFEIEEENFGLQLDKEKENPEFSAEITDVTGASTAIEDLTWTKDEETGKYVSSTKNIPVGPAAYQLQVSYTDIAGYDTQYELNFKFDGTAPELAKTEYSYIKDGKTTKSEGPLDYSNAEVLHVAFTVVEDNFIKKDFINAIKITLDGEDYTPDISVTKGEAENTWIVSFALYEQGDYSISIEGYADQAGNTMEIRADKETNTYKSGPFTIDRTPPTILIDYQEPVRGDETDKLEYHRTPIQATVTITEKYFETNAGDATITVTKTDENGNVTTKEFKGADLWTNGDGNAYSATVTLDEDGQYAISAEYTDPSGNYGLAKTANTMILDQTPPVVTINYNAPVQKTNNVAYYDGTIQGTITVREVNFFEDDFHISVNDAAIGLNWVDRGDFVHVAVFTMAADGEYEVTASYSDRSDNRMPQHESGRMIVDTKAPVITVNGVRHESANNDETISLTVSVADKNISIEEFEAVLKAIVKRDMGNNSFKYESETVSLGDKKTSTNEEGETVYTYTLENLSLDGYYTLKASATDYAGHAVKLMDVQRADGSSDQLTELNFSVNREGSVFWIETEHNDKYSGQTFVNELDGAYANDQVKLAVHEVNVDPVDTQQDYRTVFTLNDGTAMQEIALNDGAGGNYEKNQSVAEGGWYENIYTLDNSYFENDGTYSINLITYDAASNSNINSKDEGGVISFTVDRTLPIISSNIHAGEYVRASEYVVEFRVTEANLDPESISVTLDGKSVEPEALGNNEYRFTVGSGYGHVVEISAGDKANNVSEQYKINPFTVSTNIFVLWYANKLLFWGSLIGLAVICGGIGLIVTRRKRDEKDKA